jgi:phospholipase C
MKWWRTLAPSLCGLVLAASPAWADEVGCPFTTGARVATTLGIKPAQRRAIPIDHVIVVMQENRSFDHHFGTLSRNGQPEAEPLPPGFSNPDPNSGQAVFPQRARTTCIQEDPPHQWDAMHRQWNGGRMDGFVRVGGRSAMTYYTDAELPFYHWLARTFALSDRHFAPVLGGTWQNRQMLYAGTAVSRGKSGVLSARTIFDSLDDAGTTWGVYADDGVRQDCIGWTLHHRGVQPVARLLAGLGKGDLPQVAFVDASEEDEHPPGDVQEGERWFRRIYGAAVASPLWPRLAILFTYDEGGGFFDHVPPPAACPPSADRPQFDRRGIRVPFLVISPWARPATVSHQISDHSSILRFIELLHDLPALSARDANAGAFLEMFDFARPRLLEPPPAPSAGRGGCPARTAENPR